MKIRNIEGLNAADLQKEEEQGARFVYFTYTISLLVVTLRRNSGVYMLRRGESAAGKALPFTLLSLFLGWWGIPFGPKYTIEALRTNFRGGKDVTEEVMATVAGHLLFQETQQRRTAV